MDNGVRFLDPSLARKGKLLEEHYLVHEGIPLFSILEFNLSGLCNRKCVFCPRIDPAVFPNTNKHMPLEMYTSVLQDLKAVGYDGTIIFSGFSEPFLYKHLEEAIRLTKDICPQVRSELVTNGDLLTVPKIEGVFAAGLSVMSVSMYDGPQQVDQFKALREQAKLRDDQMIFRVRWLSAKEHFGITLSNRAGSVTIKDTDVAPLAKSIKKACHYPFYQILVDYDGSALLCAHDWGRKLIAGNVNTESIIDIWNNDVMKRARTFLLREDRNFKPCNRCDVHGTLIGKEHFDKWAQHYAKTQSV